MKFTSWLSWPFRALAGPIALSGFTETTKWHYFSTTTLANFSTTTSLVPVLCTALIQFQHLENSSHRLQRKCNIHFSAEGVSTPIGCSHAVQSCTPLIMLETKASFCTWNLGANFSWIFSSISAGVCHFFTPMSMAWPGAHVFQCKPWVKWCINQFSPHTTKGSPSKQRKVGGYPGRASRGNLLQRHVAYVTALTDHCLLKHAVSPHGCAQPWDWRKW